jgi:leader peptidase (prepilin peptidase)/N-methyltransferase
MLLRAPFDSAASAAKNPGTWDRRLPQMLPDLFAGPEGHVFWCVEALLLGLVVGSFANVAIHRLPIGESVVTPRSRCPRCRNPIATRDNLPVLSWLLLRGRCRHCAEPISARYPLVELANAALWVAVAWQHGVSVRAVIGALFATALLVLALIDFDHQLLPDAITKPGILVGLLASLLPGPPQPLSSVAAAVAGYAGCAAIYYLWLWARDVEALGRGDWKMIAMLGAFFGYEGMLLAVLLATFAGSVVGLSLIHLRWIERTTRVPLGTFLAAGGLATLLAGERILAWYRGLFVV